MGYLSCLNGISGFDESKATLEALGLFVKEYSDLGLYLVKYDKSKSDMTNPDVLKCRGLVLDMENNNVVCLPPPKSIKVEEFTSVCGDMSKVVYEEFLDGTMINMFNFNGSWHISTRSCIGANCRWFSTKRFDEMFEESKTFDFEKFTPGFTYTFVLQHSENRIVTNYSGSDLTLVQVVNNNTFTLEDIESIGTHIENINVRKVFTFSNILEAYSSIENMAYDIQGYVIRENNNTLVRSKMRNPKYNFVRSLRGNTRNLKYVFLDLRSNSLINSYLEYFPESRETFERFTQEFYATTRELFNFYQKFRVRKEIALDAVPYEFRPLCYELHGSYIKNRTIITFAEVKRYMNNLPPARQLFIMNYKRNAEKRQNAEATEVETPETN